MTTPSPKDAPDFLDSAATLGRRLCRDALWSGERCNWIGASMEFLPQGWTTVERSFGPDFYGGTSGIGWFLAHLFRSTGDHAVGRCAQAAFTQAWQGRQLLLSGPAYSVYSGPLGLALALADAATLLQREDWRTQAGILLREVSQSPPVEQGIDVISGSAGAIPVLLDLSTRLNAPEAREAAVRHGEFLLSRARPAEDGVSWTTINAPGQPDLTGFSHGASGIAWALLELFAVTGENRFRDAALAAIRFERRWFLAADSNWADLRESSGTAPTTGRQLVGSLAWCHGAPGIALARLRASEILREPVLREEAEIALRTTAASLEASATAEQSNYSQCHGHAGNAEALLYAAETVAPEWRQPAANAAERGKQRYLLPDSPWPCGVPNGGENPSLMLGLAGIGHFFLRLACPDETPPATQLGLPRNGKSAG